jgi:hypothetical protein
LSCWMVNLHPSLWSWAGFRQRPLCTLLRSSFPSILTRLDCRWKRSPQHDAATTMLHHRDDARFPSDVTLGIQAKEFNLGFIRPENLVSHGKRVL